MVQFSFRRISYRGCCAATSVCPVMRHQAGMSAAAPESRAMSLSTCPGRIASRRRRRSRTRSPQPRSPASHSMSVALGGGDPMLMLRSASWFARRSVRSLASRSSAAERLQYIQAFGGLPPHGRVSMFRGSERTKGPMKFLVEAVTLSVIGGAIGIAAGLTGSRAISYFAEWRTLVTPDTIAVAFGFAAAIGIFFGFYPARKTARLDPIEAPRYE